MMLFISWIQITRPGNWVPEQQVQPYFLSQCQRINQPVEQDGNVTDAGTNEGSC